MADCSLYTGVRELFRVFYIDSALLCSHVSREPQCYVLLYVIQFSPSWHLCLLSSIILYSASQKKRLSPGAKMTSFWKDKILPKIANVYAYVSIPSMDR